VTDRPDPVEQLVHTLQEAHFSVLIRAFRRLGWTIRFAPANEPQDATTTPEGDQP
jgi:hypothetical protein